LTKKVIAAASLRLATRSKTETAMKRADFDTPWPPRKMKIDRLAYINFPRLKQLMVAVSLIETARAFLADVSPV
jgi:hypothetical protein